MASSTGLRVLIVGGGFGGLTAAIECQLRGMKALIVETYPTSATYGDIIDFFPNGGRIIEKWAGGRVGRQLMDICINKGDKFQYFKADGTLIWQEPWLLERSHFWRQYAGHRGQMHAVVTNYAKELGVEFAVGDRVVRYLDGRELGVVLQSGKKYLADVVLAADGPRSIARQQILGLPDTKVNSGYAIFRAFIELKEEHRKNPWLKDFCDPNEDHTKMWVAHDLHMIIYTWNKGKYLGWVLTHKDTEDIGESWSFPGKLSDVLRYLEEGGFERRLIEIAKATPEKHIIDYKLVWRDPIPTWLSASARTAVIGDAAHCHLPTSAQGGSQAMEDGVAVAVSLDRAKGDVPLALRVFERIRFNRSHVTHMSSIEMRDGYHNVDWDGDEILKHPEIVNLPRYKWVIEHDAEENAERHFDHLAQDVKSYRPGTIQELALPAGGSYNVEERLESHKPVLQARL
ncbi:salicylate hydroxylase [Lophiostoma macrostomum CBS 122681]|uniref:Salicylate hydroxylase n=1 Tax=Lophiostoma macrostomum CBS 122681 TaxID=1314788 RepID=A0A6A6SXE1_9PLEO|nr:salicylate hydroxylase [Lophiostoma macrostomum CBS 122681]